MTESHAENLSRSLRNYADLVGRALANSGQPAAREGWRNLLALVDVVIREARASRAEADALAAELLAYRPARHDRPAAPALTGHVYVYTAKAPWVCAAVELRAQVHVQAGLGGGYLQEHCVPDRKTLCRKPVTFPVSERFTSGGWPRLHELCPACTKALIEAGLLSEGGEQ